ncbi:MAG: type III-B CRISPR module-associated protein Cmr3 [Fimbriimonadaceae bacterium]|nr:type III-B CRISPR module-associated protein Cmr3 [Fimbriimonadaceae bacterium]
MKTTPVVYRIEGLDPLVFGDGRPFSNDAGSLTRRTFDAPYPSTLAGALATHLLQGGWTEKASHDLVHELQVRGPLAVRDGEVRFAVPADAIPTKVAGKDESEFLVRVRPAEPPEGANWPKGVDRACEGAIPEGHGPVKDSTLRSISAAAMTAWLVDPGAGADPLEVARCSGSPREDRFGVGIDPASQSAEKGLLYRTTGIRLGPGLTPAGGAGSLARTRTDHALLVRADVPEGVPIPEAGALSLGGERRQAHLRKDERLGSVFACPQEVREALARTARIRLVLATPAHFGGGWLPDWLASGKRCPFAGVRFRLVAACVRRREHVSGWGYAGTSAGPKPALWLVPAGSVYFLEALGDDGGPLAGEGRAEMARKLAESWLQPVSDFSVSRRKGFGLALWGTWTDPQENASP